MRIHLGMCATLVTLTSAMGCGSYSSPSNDNSPAAPDSTGDTTPNPPPPGYLQIFAA
jgi:hypothetical protein